jgi:hypothetical protein
MKKSLAAFLAGLFIGMTGSLLTHVFYLSIIGALVGFMAFHH